jgi:hypothetical protein
MDEPSDPAIKKLWDDIKETADISGLESDEVMALIHELTARRLVEALRDPMRATPGVLQAARGFLRDNEISGLDIPGTAQEELRKAIQERAPFRLTGTD